MSEHGSYGQFCPVAMAAEIFCSRWTPLILREMYCGTRRFNDLRRGVPRMSPSLLSKRLVEMREAGIIEEVSSQTGRQGISIDRGRRGPETHCHGHGLLGPALG